MHERMTARKATAAADNYSSDFAKGHAIKTPCSASPPGGRERNRSEAGEQELKIFIGPAFALRAQHRTDMANQKLPGTDTVELIFAPAAAAIVFTNETGEDTGVPLANAGYDPNETRIPAGQPGGGQWSATGAGGVQKGRAEVAPATSAPSNRSKWKPGKKAVPWEVLQTGPSFPITTGVEGLPSETREERYIRDLSQKTWPLYAWDGRASKRFPDGLVKVNRIPKNAVKFVTASGQEFYAPEKTDFKAIYDLAKSTPPLDEPLAAYEAILHYGTFDFQRNMGRGKQKDNYFYSAYTDASNYVVGVYAHGLGQSRDFTLAIGRIILSKSKNAGDPRPQSMWLKGWDDADARTFAEPKPPAK